ncbi:MAG: hypothetical protein AAGK74_02155, partial [Chloroflexota bacterium]
MNAQVLLERGVEAISRQDVGEGRRLIQQSIRKSPKNDMAWLWLARIETDAERKRQYLQRAL